MGIQRFRHALATLAASAVVAACGAGGEGLIDPGIGDLSPRNFDARPTWVLHGWQPNGVQPIGHPAVELTWDLPPRWNGEVFRIYARPSGGGTYTLVSTVTSCAEGRCRYTDLNVTPGRSYDYFVATTDERRNQESASEVLRVGVAPAGTPETPGAPEVIALDTALFLTWASTGAERYRVFLERVDGQPEFIEIGETDGTSFLDERAENGVEYGYRIAAIDTVGRFSARSGIGLGVARPDYHTELIWDHADDPTMSGFRFRASEHDDPLVPGNDASAQWRFEAVGGVPSIRPLGSTTVTEGVFTTSLTCGPGSEPDCESVDTAPAASAFTSTPVPAETGNTYVFRVTGDDGRVHYGKIRVQGTTHASGGRVLVFDWAYQLIPEDPRLIRN